MGLALLGWKLSPSRHQQLEIFYPCPQVIKHHALSRAPWRSNLHWTLLVLTSYLSWFIFLGVYQPLHLFSYNIMTCYCYMCVYIYYLLCLILVYGAGTRLWFLAHLLLPTSLSCSLCAYRLLLYLSFNTWIFLRDHLWIGKDTSAAIPVMVGRSKCIWWAKGKEGGLMCHGWWPFLTHLEGTLLVHLSSTTCCTNLASTCTVENLDRSQASQTCRIENWWQMEVERRRKIRQSLPHSNCQDFTSASLMKWHRGNQEKFGEWKLPVMFIITSPKLQTGQEETSFPYSLVFMVLTYQWNFP